MKELHLEVKSMGVSLWKHHMSPLIMVISHHIQSRAERIDRGGWKSSNGALGVNTLVWVQISDKFDSKLRNGRNRQPKAQLDNVCSDVECEASCGGTRYHDEGRGGDIEDS